MIVNIQTDIDTAKILNNISAGLENAQKKLDAQILKDSNVYCPMDTGTLIKSGIMHTVIGTGRIIWLTPYAKAQYYMHPNKSHQKNPNATMAWFETAKSKRLPEWVRIVKDEYSRNTK